MERRGPGPRYPTLSPSRPTPDTWETRGPRDVLPVGRGSSTWVGTPRDPSSIFFGDHSDLLKEFPTPDHHTETHRHTRC